MCVSAAWRWWKVARPVAAFHRWFRQIRDSTLLAYLHTCITESLHSCILEQLQTAYLLTCCCPPPGIQADQRLYPPCILAYLHICIFAYLHNCILAYLHTCILAYLHTCILAYLHTYILAYLHTCILAYLHTCIAANLLTFTAANCTYSILTDLLMLSTCSNNCEEA